jgi:hypothetical protein
VRRTVPPSAEIEEQIDRLLAVGVGDNPPESLSELARLGARLIIQRAVEDEFDAWLGRARYERRPTYQRGLRNYGGGLRNGFRPRKVQTAEGELEVEIPQIREAAETFASKLFPRGTKLVRTEPLKALVIGASTSRSGEDLLRAPLGQAALELPRAAHPRERQLADPSQVRVEHPRAAQMDRGVQHPVDHPGPGQKSQASPAAARWRGPGGAAPAPAPRPGSARRGAPARPPRTGQTARRRSPPPALEPRSRCTTA